MPSEIRPSRRVLRRAAAVLLALTLAAAGAGSASAATFNFDDVAPGPARCLFDDDGNCAAPANAAALAAQGLELGTGPDLGLAFPGRCAFGVGYQEPLNVVDEGGGVGPNHLDVTCRLQLVKSGRLLRSTLPNPPSTVPVKLGVAMHFSTSRSRLKLRAGATAPITVRIYDRDGAEIAHQTLTPDSAQPTTTFSLALGSPSISYATVESEPQVAPGVVPHLRVDAVEVDDPAVPAPKFLRLIADRDAVEVSEETTVTVPLRIVRENGAAGPVTIQPLGAPATLASAQVQPNPTAGKAAKLTLTGGQGTSRGTTTLNATAPPGVEVGAAPRLDVSVVTAVRLDVAAEQEYTVGCRRGSLPVTITRGPGFRGTVEVVAHVASPAVIINGERYFDGEVAKSIPVDQLSRFPDALSVDLTAIVRGREVDQRRITLRPRVAPITLSKQTLLTQAFGATGRAVGQVELEGMPECEGFVARFGNQQAEVPVRRYERITVPRTATGSTLSLVPPVPGERQAEASYDLDNYRNTVGFPFPNFASGHSQRDVYQGFGIGCDGYCGLAAGTISRSLKGETGNCFGWAYLTQRLLWNHFDERGFDSTTGDAFGVPAAAGPGPVVKDWIEAVHTLQFEPTIMAARSRAYLDQAKDPSVKAMTQRAYFLIRSYGGAMISLHDGDRRHAVVAYDYDTATVAGKQQLLIRVLDPNLPYTAGEDDDTTGTAHAAAVARSTITVTDDHWSYPGLPRPDQGTGGQPGQGRLATAESSMVLYQIPSTLGNAVRYRLPGEFDSLAGADGAVIATDGGTVRMDGTAAQRNARGTVPWAAEDDGPPNDPPQATGWVFTKPGTRTASVDPRRGPVVVLGDGFAAELRSTGSPGALSLDPKTSAVTFTPKGRARTTRIAIETRTGGGELRTSTIDAGAMRGSLRVALRGKAGALEVRAARGAKVKVALRRSAKGGKQLGSFTSRRLTLGKGRRGGLRLAPKRWSKLRQGVVARDGRGHRRRVAGKVKGR